MINDVYALATSEDFIQFEFSSFGPKGEIRKIIIFEKIVGDFYNLSFGDKIPGDDLIDDLAVTNNGDSKKILATVATALLMFTAKNPLAKIIIEGSTKSRTRLYRICISNNLNDIQKEFFVLELLENDWDTFVPNNNYESFMIIKKNVP